MVGSSQALEDYISGQFSDGWGEGFFQYPFYEGDVVLAADFWSPLETKKLK